MDETINYGTNIPLFLVPFFFEKRTTFKVIPPVWTEEFIDDLDKLVKEYEIAFKEIEEFI